MTSDPPKTERGALSEFRSEISGFLRQIPDKGLFAIVLGVWLLLFHFFGNSVFGYIDTGSLLRWMYHIYNTSPDDGHGFLIPFVVLGLLYWKREQLVAIEKRIWWPALGLVGVAVMIHGIGYLLQFPQVSIVGLFLGIYALTGLVWGWAWLKETFFPMILFAFAVPLGTLATVAENVTFPLRLLACAITAGVSTTILGIDVIRDGTQLLDGGRRFQYEVAAACGGIRSLIALLALSVVFAFMSFSTFWRRGLMILAAIPLAVAGNVFRLVCIILAAEVFGQKAGEFVHDQLGLLPYLPAIGGLVAIATLLRERSAPTPGATGLEIKVA